MRVRGELYELLHLNVDFALAEGPKGRKLGTGPGETALRCKALKDMKS